MTTFVPFNPCSSTLERGMLASWASDLPLWGGEALRVPVEAKVVFRRRNPEVIFRRRLPHGTAVAALVIAGYAALQAAYVAPAIGGTGDTQPPASRFSLGPATQTSLVLNWQAGSDNIGIDHYNVYRRTSDQASGQLKVAETKQLSHTYTGLTCGTDYSLALVAEDAAGNKSDWPRQSGIRFAPSPATPRRHRRRRRVEPQTRSRRQSRFSHWGRRRRRHWF